MSEKFWTKCLREGINNGRLYWSRKHSVLYTNNPHVGSDLFLAYIWNLDKVITMKESRIICKVCFGTGFLLYGHRDAVPCPRCNKRGSIPAKETIPFELPEKYQRWNERIQRVKFFIKLFLLTGCFIGMLIFFYWYVFIS